MRTLNVRLAVLLSVILVVLAGSVYGVNRLQRPRIAHAFLRAADRAKEEADECDTAIEEAKKELDRAWEEAEQAKIQGDAAKEREARERIADAREKGGSLREDRAKNLLRAMTHYQSYLNLATPNDRQYYDTMEKQALLRAQENDTINAYTALENLLRQKGQEDRIDARKKIIELAMDGGRFDDAMQHLEYLLKNDSPDDPDPKLLDLKWRCLAGQGKAKEAVDVFQKVLSTAPNQFDFEKDRLWLYMVHLVSKELRREADKCMEELANKNSDNAKAHLARALYLMNSPPRDVERLNEALREAQKAVAMAPEDARTLLVAGEISLMKRQVDEGTAYIERAIKADRGQALGYIHLSQVMLESTRKKEDQAVAVMRRGLEATKNSPGYTEILLEFVDQLIDLASAPGPRDPKKIEENRKRFAEAQERIQELRDLKSYPPPAARVGFLQARVELARGKLDIARQILEAIRPELAGTQGRAKDVRRLKSADFWIGNCYGAIPDVEQQLVAYRRAVDTDPSFLPPRLAIVGIMRKQRKWKEAVDELNQALRTGNSLVLLLLAEVLLERNGSIRATEEHWAELERVLAQAVKLDPDITKEDPLFQQRIGLFRAEALIARGRMEESEGKLLQNRGREEAGKELQDKGRKHLADAEDALLNLRILYPDQLGYPLKLASLAGNQEKWELVEKYLQEADKEFGDRVELRLARAEYLVQRKGKDAAAELRNLAKDAQKYTKEQRIALWQVLAEQLGKVEDYQAARQLCQEAAKEDPNNPSIRAQLLQLTVMARDKQSPEELETQIRELMKQEEKSGERGGMWYYGQALTLALHAKDNDPAVLAQVQEHLVEAQKKLPNWSKVPLLAGETYMRQGKPDKALEKFLQAIKLRELTPDLVARTGALLCERQRYAEAIELMRTLEKLQLPFTRELNQVYVEALLQAKDWDGDFEQVRRLLEKAVDERSADPRQHLWRGQWYAELARRAKAKGQDNLLVSLQEEAEKSIRRAVAVNQESGDGWVVLVRLLAGTGQMEKARAVIGQAENSSISPLKAALALAQMYEAVGALDVAETKYQLAMKADPNNTRRVAEFYLRINKPDLAEPLLKLILEGKAKTTSAGMIWARRAMALLLADRGDYPSLQQALARVNENLVEAPSSIEDMRVKARLLLLYPGRAKSQDAIDTLLGLRAHMTVDDYFRIAQIYLAMNDWNKYRSAWRSVVAKQPEPRHLAAHVDALLRHAYEEMLKKRNPAADLGEAESLLPRIEQALPDQPQVLGLRARLLFARKQYDQAAKLLNDFVDAKTNEIATSVGEAKSKAQRERLDRLRLATGIMEVFAGQLKDPGQKAEAAKFLEKATTYCRLYADPLGQESKRVEELEARAKTENPLTDSEKQELARLKRELAGRKIALADFLARQEQYQESLAVLEPCWADAGAEALARVAMRIVRSGNPEFIQRAEKMVQDGLKKFDRPLVLINAMAEYCTVKERYKEAEQYYREILDKAPHYFTALNNLGVLLALRESNLDEALQLVNRALDVAGPVAAILDSRATVYIMRGEADKALKDLELAIEEEATPVRLFHQARAYYVAGKKDDSRLALEAAIKTLKPEMLDPPERPVYKQLREELGL